ncbi:MAG: ParA family protein [Burkholderiaceae bacterium]|jgi:chromosome partitioning protein|nr:ParA family protein [Burkholderiales bacterium]MCZ8336784.1 ParA family protein [Burkholderiaceae bacterium]
MPVIAVVNPKGGVGKTTLATNIAGYYAAGRIPVMLGDTDRQASSRAWLDLRPEAAAPIRTWDVRGTLARPPQGVTHVVLDTPAQIDKKKLAEVVRIADKVVVPLQPSMFDILATREFLVDLKRDLGSKRFADKVAVVGMRLDPRTHAAQELGRFVTELGVPVAGYVRDTQNYVQLAAHGLSLFDVPEQRMAADRATWASLVGWLNTH